MKNFTQALYTFTKKCFVLFLWSNAHLMYIGFNAWAYEMWLIDVNSWLPFQMIKININIFNTCTLQSQPSKSQAMATLHKGTTTNYKHCVSYAIWHYTWQLQEKHFMIEHLFQLKHHHLVNSNMKRPKPACHLSFPIQGKDNCNSLWYKWLCTIHSLPLW